MARNPALLGFGQYPNIAGFASTTVQTNATYEAVALKALNLKTIEPTEVSRITTNLPLYSYWAALLGGATVPTTRELSGFSLINLNLSPNGLVRFLGGVSVPPLVEYAPTAIATSSNITGLVTAVDEALAAPDANFIEPTTKTSAWTVRFQFATPAGTPATGAHMAMFALRMIRVDGGGDLFGHPVVSATLYESGVLVRSLGSRPVSVAAGDGQMFYFTFDPSELAAPDCSNVEVFVNCSRGIGSSGDHYAKLNTVSFVIDAGTGDGDSGWLSSPFAGQPEYEGLPQLQTDIDYFPTGTDAVFWSTVNQFVVMVRDDQATADPTITDTVGAGYSPAGAVIREPDGFVQAGVLVAGPALILERGPMQGPQSSVIVEGYEGATEGGQTYGADAFRRRAVSVTFTLNRTEKDSLLDGIDWRRGRSSPFYVNLDPDLAAEHKGFVAGWVTAAEAGPAIQIPAAYDPGDLMLYNKSYTFEERL